MCHGRAKPHATWKLLFTGLSKQARTQAQRWTEAEELDGGGAALWHPGERSGARPDRRGAETNMRLEAFAASDWWLLNYNCN